MLFALIIRIYQKVPVINRLTRLGVGVHHAIRKPQTRPCPYATSAEGGCSAHFAAMAKTAGGLAAASAALSAMSLCGPGVDSDWCAPKPGDCVSGGVDSMEWCISARGPKLGPECWFEHPHR